VVKEVEFFSCDVCVEALCYGLAVIWDWEEACRMHATISLGHRASNTMFGKQWVGDESDLGALFNVGDDRPYRNAGVDDFFWIL
jgi:hypothetical protein